MAVPAPRRPARPAAVAAAGQHRHWLSTAAAALAASVLGLALAGSTALTGSAEARPTAPGAGPRPPVVRGATPSPSIDPALLETFSFGGDGGEPLRQAIVAERAAQRAEELAKDAEAVSRAATRASEQARQQGLTAAERATQAKGAELAREALERAAAARAAAVAARAAAEAARAAAEAAARAAATPAPTPAPGADPTSPAPVDPGPTGPVPGDQAGPSASTPPATASGGAAPVPGAVVGASFGQYGLWSRYHTGLDFRAAYGVPIRAVKSGTVLYAGNSGNWSGNHVAVRHGDGMTTMSSHMSSMSVQAGDTVQAGQVIGYVGQTGRAFGAHLHFELYPVGVTYGDVYKAVDPVPWLRAAGVTTR